MNDPKLLVGPLAAVLACAGSAVAQQGVLFAAQEQPGCATAALPTLVFDDDAWRVLYAKPWCIPPGGAGQLCACPTRALAVDQDLERIYFALGRGDSIAWWDNAAGSYGFAPGSLPAPVESLAFAEGNLYGMTGGFGRGRIFRITPGSTSAVEILDIGTDLGIDDLSYNPGDGLFYGFNQNTASPGGAGVYSIDILGDGAVELVAPTPESFVRFATAVWGDDVYAIRESSAFPSYRGSISAGGDWEAFTPSPSPGFAGNIVSSAVAGWLAPPLGSPCPADLDGDGVLTVFDFLEFQSLFAMGDLAADFDGDGDLTIFDFLEFQNIFALGCP
ncbi:MAG: GC-type dockerin domain-anchored protein [Planctomycetota bacterium]